MSSVIFTTQPTSLSATPGQNTTFSAVASANFSSAVYSYQWSRNSVNIVGATSSSYFIDPLLADNGSSFTVSVSALSGAPLRAVATATSSAAVLTVLNESGIFAKFALYPESGVERFTRLRNLGYV
jgi:hypothetical protein